MFLCKFHVRRLNEDTPYEYNSEEISLLSSFPFNTGDPTIAGMILLVKAGVDIETATAQGRPHTPSS